MLAGVASQHVTCSGGSASGVVSLGQAQCLPKGQSLSQAKSGVGHSVAHECNKSSWCQEDVTPDEPLKEAVVGLWYDDLVPKPNIKVVFVQMTLILLTDCSWHPYGIPKPLPDPVADVFRSVDIHGEVTSVGAAHL